MKDKIELGAGNRISDISEWINHDLTKHREEIEIVFDLDKFPYPLKNNSMQIIRAYDVLEHLEDVIKFMNECWRILKKDGILDLRVCGWKNQNGWVDITHKRLMDIKSMDYFCPGTDLGTQYNFYTDKKWQIISANEDRKTNPVWKLTPIK